jgi:PKD repeat protein
MIDQLSSIGLPMFYSRLLSFLTIIFLLQVAFANAETTSGELSFIDASGNQTETFQGLDSINVRVNDADVNTNAGAAETLTVLVTTDTENTGTPFSATTPVAGSGNVGDGTMSKVSTGFSTVTEDWTVIVIEAIGTVSDVSFQVEGSVSGIQSKYTLSSNNSYTSDNGEVTFTITNGNTSFQVADKFTFSTTAGTYTGETVTLTETGNDTGVFEGAIEISKNGTSSNGNNILEIKSGDVITAIYEDAAGDWGGSETNLASALYAETVLTGGVLQDSQVWTEGNSPYLVTGDITVGPGVTLTLDAGTTVLFLANQDDMASGQTVYDSELIIDGGSLNLVGTQEKPVILSSSSREASKGDWGGVYLTGDASIDISYAEIKYSGFGIKATQAGSDQTVFSIKDSLFENNTLAFDLENLNTNDKEIIRNRFVNNGQMMNLRWISSYDLSTSEFLISENVIEDNAQNTNLIYAFGLYQKIVFTNNLISSSGNYLNFDWIYGEFEFTNNAIKSSGGVRLGPIGENGLKKYVVSGNKISAGEFEAYTAALQISGRKLLDLQITDNEISGFKGDGIYLSFNEFNVDAQIKNNIIRDNNGYGVVINGQIRADVVGNEIANNKYGLFLSYSDINGDGSFDISGNKIIDNQTFGIQIKQYTKPVIVGNDIYGNGTYAIDNQTAYDIKAKSNWWGSNETAEIETGSNPKNLTFIYDEKDDASLGFVNYSSWLKAALVRTIDKNAPVIVIADIAVASENAVVTLDASKSYDPNGSIASFVWSQTSGEPVTLVDAESSTSTFTAPTLGEAASYEFKVVVTDDAGNVAQDYVTVTVKPENVLPTANAGSDMIVEAGALVTLDASASSDSDGTIGAYKWSQTDGASIYLSSTSKQKVTFYAPTELTQQVLTFNVEVTDDRGGKASDTVTVTVNPAEVDALIAVIGKSASFGESPLTIAFDAAGSSGDITSYSWVTSDGQESSSANPSFTFTELGKYAVSLTITGSLDQQDTARAEVEVTSPNVGPTAKFIASERRGDAPLSVRFDASGSTDDKGIVSYQWKSNIYGGESDQTAEGEVVNLTFDQAEIYEITLTVTDAEGETDSAKTLIVVDEEPSKKYTTLDIELSASSIEFGKSLDVAMNLSAPGYDNESFKDNVTLTITDPADNVYKVIQQVDSSGRLSLTNLGKDVVDTDESPILFEKKGLWSFVASFAGTNLHLPATSEVAYLSVGSSAGYAVVVQGRDSTGEGLDAHNKTTNRVYTALKKRGFEDQNIFYFNHTPDQEGIVIDAAPTKQLLQSTIEGLADKVNENPAPMFFFLVDHGESDGDFLLNETEFVKPEDFASWMATLESNLSSEALLEPRVSVLGFCYSGQFISAISGERRIVISSAASDEPSWRGVLEPDGIAAGEYFVEEFVKQMVKGKDLKASFVSATDLTESYVKEQGFGKESQGQYNKYFDDSVQHPLLDDNGDQKGSNDFEESLDGTLAESVVLGVGANFRTNSAENPADILSVSSTIYLSSGDSDAFLTMAAVDSSEVEQAIIEVRRPDVVLDSSDSSLQKAANYERSFMLFPGEDGNPSTTEFSYKYDQFDEPGLYEIFYYVTDKETKALSAPKRSYVYKDATGNQAPSNFGLLAPFDGASTKTVVVFEWEAASDPEAKVVSYVLEVADNTEFTRFNGENGVYSQESIVVPTAVIDVTADLQDLTQYYWRVVAVDDKGKRTVSSQVNRLTTNNDNQPYAVVKGVVYDKSTLRGIAGARVDFNVDQTNISVLTASNGSYAALLPESRVSVSMSVSSYNPVTLSDVAISLGDVKEPSQSLNIATTSNGDVEVDTVKPVITLLGSAAISLNVGATYEELGARATDDVDGDITANIQKVGSVDTSTEGTYTITYSVSDAAGNNASKVRTVTVAAMAINDADNDGVADEDDKFPYDATESLDTDNDGMGDNFEDSNGFDKNDATDAGADFDGDGVSNLDEFKQGSDPTLDDYAPTFKSASLAEINITASGKYTKVTLPEVLAEDGLDGEIVATHNINDVLLPSGKYTVTWTAKDAAGNSTTKEQTLIIHPLAYIVSMANVKEGNDIDIEIGLTGEAQTYPVKVPVSLTGSTAEGLVDYSTALSVNIDGTLKANLAITTSADQESEGDEIVQITLKQPDNNVGLSSYITSTVNIIEEPAVPITSMTIVQGGVDTRVINQFDGLVTVTATVHDVNGNHSLDWSGTDNTITLTQGSTDKVVTFDPSSMVDGFYLLHVDVSDDGLPGQVSSRTVQIEVTTESRMADSDNDGVPDEYDSTPELNMLGVVIDGEGVDAFITDPGTILSMGNIVRQVGVGTEIDLASISDYGLPADDNYTLIGASDLEIELPVAGQSAIISFFRPIQSEIPAGAVIRVLVDGAWQSFTSDTANIIESAFAVKGNCPLFTSNAYSEGLQAGVNCIKILVQDGGPNDADGQTNGIITSIMTVGVTEGGSIGGSLLDWLGNTIKAVSVVVTDLNDQQQGSGGVNTDGSFSVESNLSSGDAHLVFTKAEAIDAGTRPITSADALAALKIAVGLNPNSSGEVSPYQFIAADINNDGRVTSADALAILKVAVGLESLPDMAWVFMDSNADTSAITKSSVPVITNNVNVTLPTANDASYIGIMKGNVNGL